MLLLVVIVVFSVLWIWLRKRAQALFYIVASGVIYGFVATLAKVVIKRIQAGNFEWLTLLCLVALLAAVAVGAYFVQTAYSSGPPDLVIAGLTVIDPMVAVLIGLIVLQEAAAAPLPGSTSGSASSARSRSGASSQLARYHPQILSDSQEHADRARQRRVDERIASQHRIDPPDRGGREGMAGTAGQRQRRSAEVAEAESLSRRHVDLDPIRPSPCAPCLPESAPVPASRPVPPTRASPLRRTGARPRPSRPTPPSEPPPPSS